MVFKCQEDSFIKQIQDDAGDISGMSQSTISLVCKQVALAIVALRAEWIKMPQSDAEQNSVIAGFYSLCGFRQVIGAIDGTHIRIPKVGGDVGQYYINRKGYSSINVQYSSVVLKCEPTTEPVVEYGKTSPFEGYQVTLEETILFPAGGGQPHDIGRLNSTEVVQVLRKGDEALHFTKEPIPVGTVVEQEIDWDRRFDHMQQHSGQHLLSAILEKEHNLPTTSWWLGADESYVELETVKINSDVIADAEKKCNQLIQEAVPVNVKFCKVTDPELNEAHTRGLPKDCMETIRIISIGTIDENMCCGTHVSNLSQLQMIKLTGIEPGKKGKTILKFLVGNRVTKTFQLMTDRERALTGLLKNEPSRHEELIQKLQKNLKIANKNLQNVLQELAQCEVDKIKNADQKPKYLIMFKKEATPEFNRAILKGLDGEGLFMFLVSEDPEKPKEGQIIIQGPEEDCNALGTQITELLNCKGAFKNGKFQGKAGNLSGMTKCKKLIEEYFDGR